MLKLIFVIIFIVAAVYAIPELIRSRKVAKAKEEFREAQDENQELTIQGITTLQDEDNAKIEAEFNQRNK